MRVDLSLDKNTVKSQDLVTGLPDQRGLWAADRWVVAGRRAFGIAGSLGCGLRAAGCGAVAGREPRACF